LHQDSNIPPSPDVVPLLNASVADLNILVVSLSATSFTLLLITGALAFVVFRLKQRPRIVRKRFISTSPPPVPSKNSCGGEDAGDGVRLDIEDCCNMTLCDTPCFEPPTRGPKRSAGRRTGGGCQDKRSLLSNQDDDSLDFWSSDHQQIFAIRSKIFCDKIVQPLVANWLMIYFIQLQQLGGLECSSMSTIKPAVYYNCQ